MNTQTICNLDVIHKTDCIAFMQQLPSESVDLIVTDPPYLMNYKTRRRKNRNDKFCSAIIGDTSNELIVAYIKECYRILKNNSACYMFCNANKVEFFKTELQKYFNIKNIIVWVKNNHTAGDLVAQYGKRHEFIFYVNKGRSPIRNGRISDVWEFDKVPSSRLLHQNQKPVELIKQCITKSSDAGGVVFDGFMGSGTTAIACLETDRHYIGCELDEEYYLTAIDRITDYQINSILK